MPVLFPNIDAFVWFNWNSGTTSCNWPIEGGDNLLPYWLAPVDWPSVNAFSNGIASPYYLPNVVANLKASPIQPITLLNPPTALSASITNATVRLAWSAVAGATNYNLYRSTSGSKGSFYRVGSTAGTNWTDTTTIYGSSYYYVVAAENIAGESLDSARVSAAIPRPGLSAQVTLTNTLLLSWAASFTGFALESNSDLGTTNWQNVTAPVNVVAGYNRVTVGITVAGEFSASSFNDSSTTHSKSAHGELAG